MRTLFAVILFCVSLAYAEDTNITSKVFERHDKDGKVNFCMETVYRGKTKVMAIMSRTNRQGDLTVTARCYLVGGKLVMTEADEDRDGTFETIATYNPDREDMEIFSRQPDGSVRPVDAKVVEASKKQNAAFSEFFDKAFEKEMSDQELTDSITQTQKKIQDAEKEKKDNKK